MGDRSDLRPPADPRSVEPAAVAPSRGPLTYVWPAVSLGPVWEVLEGLLVAVVPPPSAVQLASALTAASRPIGASAIPPPSVTQSAPAANSDHSSLPAGGEISQLALIVLMTALLAVFAYTVRNELRTIRWPR